MARVLVVFTGGTISMREDSTGGNVPSLRGSDLLGAVPGLGQVADIEAIDWGLVPGSHLSFEQVLDIGRTIGAGVAGTDIDGAVIVQGTDNIEETAFAWDLLPLSSKPIIVVGAMRSASQDGYDGPENIRNAVAAAVSPALVGQGVIVAMDGELHGADDVRKTNTHAYGTFKSLNAGPLGFVSAGSVHLMRRREQIYRLPVIPERAAAPVQLLMAVLGQDRRSAWAVTEGAVGVVIEATGSGNTHPMLLELAEGLRALAVPVVLTTRAPSGRVALGYGFPGGSSTWWSAGVLFAGYLGGLKARMALALGLGAGLDHDGLTDLYEAFGGGRRPT